MAIILILLMYASPLPAPNQSTTKTQKVSETQQMLGFFMPERPVMSYGIHCNRCKT